MRSDINLGKAMTVGEVAVCLAISKRTTESLISENRMPSHKVGRRRWIYEAELIEFVKSCTVYPPLTQRGRPRQRHER